LFFDKENIAAIVQAESISLNEAAIECSANG
jgi:hypothetical protein